MVMFSVVICTYNRSHVVPRAIDSVLAQDWTDLELLVVDDGSADDTPQVLAGYDDPRMRVIRRSNGGLSAARNTGILEAQGRFVAFLDDDDWVDRRWLSAFRSVIGERTGVVSCGLVLYDVTSGRSHEVGLRQHSIYPEFRGRFMAGTFAVERGLLLEVGGYAEDIRVSHQSELLLRVLPVLRHRGLEAAVVDEALLTVERREAADRPLSQPADLLDGAEYLIRHHGDALATAPHALANYHAIAGVSAAKIGDWRRSRRHLRRAVLVHRRDRRHTLRYLTSLCPPAARRIWHIAP